MSSKPAGCDAAAVQDVISHYTKASAEDAAVASLIDDSLLTELVRSGYLK